MANNPRSACDPRIVATLNYNSHRFRIVAYDAGAKYLTDHEPYYWLDIDKLTENAMGEQVWTRLDLSGRSADADCHGLQTELLLILLGYRALKADEHIQPAEDLGRHYLCSWGPEQIYSAERGKPYPLQETIWAPSEWFARAIFMATHSEAMAKLYAEAKRESEAKKTWNTSFHSMPLVDVKPCGPPGEPATTPIV